MLLPNADLAQIDPEKLHGYLLSSTHPVGRFKARFFVALGYAPERWQELEADLRIQHLTQDAHPGESMREGQLYTIRAILKGPTGQSAVVLSVWFVPAAGGSTALRDGLSWGRQVTVHPLDVVVLIHDVPAHGLRRGDVGAVVEIYGPESIGVEFVAASGRTQALVTLRPDDLRAVADDDLIAVRPARS